MDLLLDVQLQLSRVVTSVAQPPHSFATSCPASTALMTPVLIHIEQLLDKIRAATRAIASKHSEQGSTGTAKPQANTARSSTEFVDFRVKLESEDIVDFASETETEDEEEDEREEEQRDGGEMRDGIGAKRPREVEDDEDEPQSKRQETQLETGTDIQLRWSIDKFVQSVTECSSVSKDAPTHIVWKAVTGLIQASSQAIKQMGKMTQDGGIPDVKLAEDFCGAVVQLPEIITRCHAKKKVSPKWIKTTSAYLKYLYSFALKNPTWPTCFSASSFESTPEAIRGLLWIATPDILHKMEGYIERVTKSGPLHADQMEKPVGKLASFFRNDFKSAKLRGKGVKRTEEEWGRFAAIGKVLAEWIYKSQKAKKPPKTRKHLLRFDLQLKGFAKKNPNRVPPILLEASTILVQWISQKNASKPATDSASSC